MSETKIEKKLNLLDVQPKFELGERVHLELKDVPVEQRDNTFGYIININLKYPRSDKLRRIVYTVRLEGKYIKPECIIYENIEHDFSCAETSLRKLQTSETSYLEFMSKQK